jgi:hypothetical protein
MLCMVCDGRIDRKIGIEPPSLDFLRLGELGIESPALHATDGKRPIWSMIISGVTVKSRMMKNAVTSDRDLG